MKASINRGLEESGGLRNAAKANEFVRESGGDSKFETVKGGSKNACEIKEVQGTVK